MLDAKYYKFSTQHVVIPKGNVDSEMVTIEFSNLIDLDIDTSFLLPVTIGEASGGMSILDGSKNLLPVVLLLM